MKEECMRTGLRSEEAGSAVSTWQQLLDEGVRILRAVGITEADLDAWYLLSAAFQIDRVHFLMDRTRPVLAEQLKVGQPIYRDYLKSRAEHIPLQQILGVQEFMGLELYVNEHVLIPRQDTEKLVEEVLKHHRETDCSVLDMCTGSGCIAISLAVLGGYDRITAADRSLEALKVAKKNGSSLLEGRKQLVFVESDMFSNLDVAEKYDIIVSNPPYIPSSVIEELAPEVREHEPRMALDGAEDGLYFYRILSDKSRAYLNDGGSIYFEIGYDQAEAVTGLLLNDGYKEIKVIKDEPGLDRVVEAVWHCK